LCQQFLRVRGNARHFFLSGSPSRLHPFSSPLPPRRTSAPFWLLITPPRTLPPPAPTTGHPWLWWRPRCRASPPHHLPNLDRWAPPPPSTIIHQPTQRRRPHHRPAPSAPGLVPPPPPSLTSPSFLLHPESDSDIVESVTDGVAWRSLLRDRRVIEFPFFVG
jgi:hypothetical protein